MVQMTMRSVKPSCLRVSAHTRPAGPAGGGKTLKEKLKWKETERLIEVENQESGNKIKLTRADDNNMAEPCAGVNDG